MRRTPAILLVIGFVLLAGIIGAVASFTLNVERSIAERAQIFQASVQLGLVFSALQDVETSQRGYLVTHDESYLSPYGEAVKLLPERIAALDKALAGRPEQLADFEQIKSLIPRKLAEIQQTIDLARTGQIVQAVAIVRTGSGKAVMDEIRTAVDRMRVRQVDAVAAAGTAVSDAATRLRYGVGVVGVLVLFFGGFAFVVKRRERLAVERHARVVEEQSHALEESNAALRSEIETRQTMEAQVRQMQKMEAVGQLSGGLAHDFNNMLAVVISALALIQRRIAKQDFDISKYIESAADAANRAANLTKRLLAFSRQQPLAPAALDANKMVAEMSELLRGTIGENIRLETVLAGGLWRVRVDQNQLENAIINLAVNARDAMPSGGRITIETANTYLDEEYARQNAEAVAGQYVLIAVTDTGTGMAPEIVARAFDPFFTTKKVGQGTGLGLSQVYGFVKQSGGHIKIYSEVGQGTTVKLYLPRHFGSDLGTAATPDSKAGALPAPTNELILVVEDEDRVRALTCDTLNEIGYATIAAGSATEALNLLEKHPEIVLLFTDIVMPDMNGRRLAELALGRRPELKVLYTTGFTRNAVVHNGILDPGVHFIAKPFVLEQLAAKIREAIDAK